MSTGRKIWLYAALTLGAVRLFFWFVRTTSPKPMPAVVDPTSAQAAELSERAVEREAKRDEQRAQIAVLLDASVKDLAGREQLDEARSDARRALRELAQEANAAGSKELALAAFDLEQQLTRDARRTCAPDSLPLAKVNAAAAKADGGAAQAERLALVQRHVTRACELARK